MVLKKSSLPWRARPFPFPGLDLVRLATTTSEQRRQRILHHMLLPYVVLNLIGILFTAGHIRISLGVATVILVLAYHLNRHAHIQMAAVIAVVAAFLPSYVALAFLPEFSLAQVNTVAIWNMVGILLGLIWLMPGNLLFSLTLNYTILALLPVTIEPLRMQHMAPAMASLFVVSTLALIATSLRQRELAMLDSQSDSLRESHNQLKAGIDELQAEISERHRVEQRLQNRELMLTTVMNHIHDAVLLVSGDGAILSANNFAARLFKSTKPKLVGTQVDTLLSGLTHGQVFDSSQGARENIPLQLRQPNGDELPVELSCTPIELDAKPHYVFTLRDISERRRVERMKDEFIATVSHELRTPITAILGAAGLIRGIHPHTLDDKTRPLIEITYNNSVTLANLVNDILDVSKLEAGKLDLHYQDTAIAPLIDEVVGSTRSYATPLGVEVVLGQRLTVTSLYSDSTRIRQIFNNLLSNAVKHSPPKGQVTINVTHDEDDLIVAIGDHGPGIPEAFRDKIFGKFAQAAPDRRRLKGTGLGLYLTRALVEQLNGHIWYESEVGRGTTFFFTLPLR